MEVFIVLGIAVAVGCAFAVGKVAGKHEQWDRFADDTHARVLKAIVEPWYKSFNARCEPDGSYVVNEALLRECAGVAQDLYQLQSILPDLRKSGKSGVWPFNEYVTTTQSFFSCGFIDPHFGRPTGYIDAFTRILRDANGQFPKVVWLNEDTLDVALKRQPNGRYIEITLEQLDSSKHCRPQSSS